MLTVKHLSIALVAACAVCASAEDFTPDDESYMDAMASVVKAVAYPAIKYGKLWGNFYKGNKHKTYSKDDIINSLTNQLWSVPAKCGGRSWRCSRSLVCYGRFRLALQYLQSWPAKSAPD